MSGLKKNAANDMSASEMERLRARVDELEAKVRRYRDRTQDRRTPDLAARLRQGLMTIRKLSRLIAAETDPQQLIERACATLTEMLGYQSAWIALIDAQGSSITKTASSGCDDALEAAPDRLERGEFPDFMRKTLAQSEALVFEDPPAVYPDCPWARHYAGHTILAQRLGYGETIYGIVAVSVLNAFNLDVDEQRLFQEVIDNLGFAFFKINAQAQMGNALRESDTRFHSLVEQFPYSIALFSPDGRLTYGNPASVKLHDATPEILQRLYQTYNIFKDKQLINRGLLPYIKKGFAGEIVELPLVRYDLSQLRPGSLDQERWLRGFIYPVKDEGGEIKEVVLIHEDITKRKQAEAALRESEDRFRILVEAAPMSILLMRDGKFVYGNSESARLLGLDSPEHIVGMDALTHIAPEFRDIVRARMDRFENGEANSPIEVQLITSSGARVWIVSASVPILLEGKPTAVIVGQNITAQKRSEADRMQLEQQLHQAQKLESVGRLAGGVAHDLNNLLSPILGYSEMLLDDPGSKNRPQDALESIFNAGMRARDLVHQLLAFSRKQALEFKLIELNTLLKNFKKLLRRTIREDIFIHMALTPSLPQINGDVGQLEQVVMNLAVNAQDAMPDGGQLTIGTAPIELDDRSAAQHEGVSAGKYVMLVVSDDGCGMNSETRAQIFEPFFTTKGKDQGTGLGLATVYGIVRQHGGIIWVSSKPGSGATFRIYLPVSTETSERPDRASKAPSNSSGSETVLLVEDNEEVRGLALTILKREGYTVLTAANGTEALALSDQYAGSVQLLLTDVIMPEMNGKQLYDRISGAYPKIKVLYMSGYTENVIFHHGVMTPGVQFLQKPFSVKALTAKVRQVLDQ